MFFGRTDAKAETPILWPPHAKSWLIWKGSEAGRDWGQKEKGTTEDEMAGWHHWLDGHEFGWTPLVGDGQGGLACCNSWGHKESDTTEQLNWTELNWINNKSVSKTNILIYRFSTRYIKHMTLRRQLRNSLGSVFRPQDHILFARLWTVPSGLVPRVSCLIASCLLIIINFFCGPCRGLLFFYSSCLLQDLMPDKI